MLPVVALLLFAGLGLVAVVRTSLVTHEAARLAARVAAVDADDRAVRQAVRDVLGPEARVDVSPRRVRQVVRVTVSVPVAVPGWSRTVSASAAALVEPAVGP